MEPETNLEPDQRILQGLVNKIQAGSTVDVAKEIHVLREAYPLSVNLLKFCCIVQDRLNNNWAAILSGKRALLIMPEEPSLYQTVGNVFSSKKNYTDAITLYNRGTVIQPSNHILPFNLGNVYLAAGKSELAEEGYRKALELRKSFYAAASNLGNLLTKKGKYSEALIYLRRSIQLEPSYLEAQINLGILFSEIKRHEESYLFFRRATMLDPESAVSHFNIANSLSELGRYGDAILEFKEAIRIQPNYSKAYHNLGRCYKEIQKLDSAIVSFQHSLRLEPDYEDAYHNLGNTLIEAGKYQDAILKCKEAIVTNPVSTNLYFIINEASKHVGLTCLSNNNYTRYFILKAVQTAKNSDQAKIIKPFVDKMVMQDRIPTFFDNAVFNQLTSPKETPIDYIEIFARTNKSKVQRFISLSDRSSNPSKSYLKERLFSGLPFLASQGTHSLIRWKEYVLYKTAFDLVIYWMLINEIKPDTIIEFGAGQGGSAVWFADIAEALGLDTKIISYDIVKPNIQHKNVTFIEYDLKMVDRQTPLPYNNLFIGKKLFIEDAHVNIGNLLNALDGLVETNDYLIIEDSDIKTQDIEDFIGKNNRKYQLDQYFLDFFGTNVTCSINSIFKVF